MDSSPDPVRFHDPTPEFSTFHPFGWTRTSLSTDLLDNYNNVPGSLTQEIAEATDTSPRLLITVGEFRNID